MKFSKVITNPNDRRIRRKNLFQHFKGGIYWIIAVAMDSETKEQMVVYKNISDKKIWVRPLDMFLSKVDTNKYPNAKQVFRFERVVKYRTEENQPFIPECEFEL